jgi:site-specific DNA-methyltransferase (adenine-specific)
MKLTDVLKFSQEAHITGKWNHPTMKPPKLCSAIIRTCSKKGMNMLVPFGGSGSECIEGHHAGLNVIASELCPEYYAMAQERIKQETAQMSLFNQ